MFEFLVKIYFKIIKLIIFFIYCVKNQNYNYYFKKNDVILLYNLN